jgi:hypothetical protein
MPTEKTSSSSGGSVRRAVLGTAGDDASDSVAEI